MPSAKNGCCFFAGKKGLAMAGQSVKMGLGEISTPYEAAQNELRDVAMVADLTLMM
jgi:hypothetical protein